MWPCLSLRRDAISVVLAVVDKDELLPIRFCRVESHTVTLLDQTLIELTSLLRKHQEADWAISIEGLSRALRVDPPAEVATKWLVIFGGMGSFSDLVLHDEAGHLLIQENGTLSSLRSKLHKQLLELSQS